VWGASFPYGEPDGGSYPPVTTMMLLASNLWQGPVGRLPHGADAPGYRPAMSESQQEQAAQETGVPASPGHHGGPVPVSQQPDEPTTAEGVDAAEVDEAGAGHPHGLEPRAGRDS